MCSTYLSISFAELDSFFKSNKHVVTQAHACTHIQSLHSNQHDDNTVHKLSATNFIRYTHQADVCPKAFSEYFYICFLHDKPFAHLYGLDLFMLFRFQKRIELN